MKLSVIVRSAIFAVLFLSCGGGSGSDRYVSMFNTAKTDVERMTIIMKHAEPDSVARFICNSALGLNDSVKIDNLQDAVIYVYETYKDMDLAKFSEEFDQYASSRPLSQKMQLLKMAALTDPEGLGYKLGLEYAIKIRDNKMSVAEVDREIEEFKRACGDDTKTYERMLNGLSVALSTPEFAGLSKELISKYGKHK